jgi:hypothetical protein
MRQIKTCPACGRQCAATSLDCEGCGYALDHVDPTFESAAAPRAPDPATPVAQVTAAVMPCGQPCVPTRQADGTCFDCGRALPAPALRVWVQWPWNQKTEIVGSLFIGRVQPAPPELAARLESQFDNVSRRHATLTLEAGGLCVCDHGSANGTFLDGARLEPNKKVDIAPGATLRFASDLSVTFAWEGVPVAASA